MGHINSRGRFDTPFHRKVGRLLLGCIEPHFIETLGGSFSAGSKPMFVLKNTRTLTDFLDLQELHAFTPLQTQCFAQWHPLLVFSYTVAMFRHFALNPGSKIAEFSGFFKKQFRLSKNHMIIKYSITKLRKTLSEDFPICSGNNLRLFNMRCIFRTIHPPPPQEYRADGSISSSFAAVSGKRLEIIGTVRL